VIDGELRFDCVTAATKQLQALLECKSATVVKGPGAGKVLVDTARIYQTGESEEQLGAILKEHPDWVPRISIHTKANPMISQLTKANVKQQCNDSLAALGVKSVDIYYIHSPDITVDYDETLSALDELHREGKFKEFGLSAFPAWDVVRIYHICKDKGYVKPTVYQGVYNAIRREVEAELLPALKTYGIRFYCYNPVAGGLLTGRYQSFKDTENLTEGRFSENYNIASKTAIAKGVKHGGVPVYQMYRNMYFKEQLFKAVQIINEACTQEKIGMAEAAIRWLKYHSALKGNYYDGILFGASKIEQMTENLKSYEGGPLPSSIVTAYDEAWKVAKSESTSYFRGFGPGMGSSETYLKKFE